MADQASLAPAREVFRRGYADLIQKGRSIKIATDTRPGTVADLFEAYIDNLKETGESSWREGPAAAPRPVRQRPEGAGRFCRCLMDCARFPDAVLSGHPRQRRRCLSAGFGAG
jgi:hypothetical protein